MEMEDVIIDDNQVLNGEKYSKKVRLIRNKFSSIREPTFKKFHDADKTPTKKYLEYYLMIWNRRHVRNRHITVDNLIKLVNKFDELLNYIPVQEKDIYSGKYHNLSDLKYVVDAALDLKDEKSFNRDEHVEVILETDKYLLIRPITHKGSLKYGAGTRWCTASRTSPGTFTTYTRTALLMYLIDKGNRNPNDNYSKIALYSNDSRNIMTTKIDFYNRADSRVEEHTVIENNWDIIDLCTIINAFRVKQLKFRETKKSVDVINKTIKCIESINVDEFIKHSNILKNMDNSNNNYIDDSTKILTDFLIKIKEYR